jgi:hypothetical protein
MIDPGRSHRAPYCQYQRNVFGDRHGFLPTGLPLPDIEINGAIKALSQQKEESGKVRI